MSKHLIPNDTLVWNIPNGWELIKVLSEQLQRDDQKEEPPEDQKMFEEDRHSITIDIKQSTDNLSLEQIRECLKKEVANVDVSEILMDQIEARLNDFSIGSILLYSLSAFLLSRNNMYMYV